MICRYGPCEAEATHYVDRVGAASRRSGPVCGRHARACGARFKGEPRPRPIRHTDVDVGYPSQEAILRLARPIIVPVRQNLGVVAEFFALSAESA